MYLDNSLIFSEEQAVTATADATNDLDLLAAGDADMWLEVMVDTAFESATAKASVTFALSTSAAADFATSEVLWSSGAVEHENLTAGKTFKVKLPAGVQRYLRMSYTVSTTMTAGKVNAYLVWDVQRN